MWKGTAPQLFTAAVVSIGMLAGLGPLVSNAKNSQVSELKALSDFSAIADTAARSKAIFQEASRVITDPRCMNCHPATRSPTQGDDMHPHVPPITAADSPLGTPGMMCTTCHGPENRIILDEMAIVATESAYNASWEIHLGRAPCRRACEPYG
jgi:hypothetical protein